MPNFELAHVQATSTRTQKESIDFCWRFLAFFGSTTTSGWLTKPTHPTQDAILCNSHQTWASTIHQQKLISTCYTLTQEQQKNTHHSTTVHETMSYSATPTSTCCPPPPQLLGPPSSAFTVPSNAKVPVGAGPKPARKSARAAALCFTRRACVCLAAGHLDWPHESWRQRIQSSNDCFGVLTLIFVDVFFRMLWLKSHPLFKNRFCFWCGVFTVDSEEIILVWKQPKNEVWNQKAKLA